jgi:short-subunit dehydrogenase
VKLADELEQSHGIATRTVALDLSRENILDILTPVTDPLDVGLLVNNAGISTVGPFLERDADYLLRQLHTNARAALILTRHFGRLMAERRRGGIIFLSSGAALHGTPWSANYSGTKAYNLMLAESLWAEWRPLGIDVLGFMAGLTHTPGMEANHLKPNRLIPLGQPGPLVRLALKTLGKKPSTSDGLRNRLGYLVLGFVPRAFATGILGKSMSAMFGPFRNYE